MHRFKWIIYFDCYSCRSAYGSTAHFLNMFMYLLGLLPLTNLIVNLRPALNTTDHHVTMVEVSFFEVLLTLIICIE